MKNRFLILFLLVFAASASAQTIARNDAPAKNPAVTTTENASNGGAIIGNGYSVSLLKNRHSNYFEIISPKADTVDVKLLDAGGSPICTIHKGHIRPGKNIYKVSSKKIHSGLYYAVSKLSSGEQFADPIMIEK